MPYGIMINCTAVLIGGLMGAFLKDYFPDKLKESLPGIFGLSAITMGVTLIIRLESLSAVILAVIIGTVRGPVRADCQGYHGLFYGSHIRDNGRISGGICSHTAIPGRHPAVCRGVLHTAVCNRNHAVQL